jgi:hypothetical protein
MNRKGIVVLAVFFIAMFAGLLGLVIGSNHFDKGLPRTQAEVADEQQAPP